MWPVPVLLGETEQAGRSEEHGQKVMVVSKPNAESMANKA